jgi:hypothetical protein
MSANQTRLKPTEPAAVGVGSEKSTEGISTKQKLTSA